VLREDHAPTKERVDRLLRSVERDEVVLQRDLDPGVEKFLGLDGCVGESQPSTASCARAKSARAGEVRWK
jgi:hypothetical protein